MLTKDPITESLHVPIPDEVLPVVGERMGDTRMYEQWGSGDDLEEYFNFLCETYGGLVSPGGAAQMAGVSRAAVHKRMKAGKLTAFLFHTSIEKGSRGRQTPFVHIPTSEIRAWKNEIYERVETQAEALNITKKDESMDFMQKTVRQAKKELKKRGIQIYGDPFG
jgi:hypothetical protein